MKGFFIIQVLAILHCVHSSNGHKFGSPNAMKIREKLQSSLAASSETLLLKTSFTTHHSPAKKMALGLRGGQAPEMTVLDFSRQAYQLQVLAAYSTVTALVVHSCLRLYTSTSTDFPQRYNHSLLLSTSFMVTTALCILSGAFTAVLFTILCIYSHSALSKMNDIGYLGFQAATAIYEVWGFRTFLLTVGSFVASFLLSLYQKTMAFSQRYPQRHRAGTIVMLSSLLLTLVGAFHIKHVLDLANEFIFTPEFSI